MEFVSSADITAVRATGSRFSLIEWMDIWAMKVSEIHRQLDQSEQSSGTWGISDYEGTLVARDAIESAIDQHFGRPVVVPLVAGIDNFFRSFTEVRTEFPMSPGGRRPDGGWWWKRVPLRGLVRTEYFEAAARCLRPDRADGCDRNQG